MFSVFEFAFKPRRISSVYAFGAFVGCTGAYRSVAQIPHRARQIGRLTDGDGLRELALGVILERGLRVGAVPQLRMVHRHRRRRRQRRGRRHRRRAAARPHCWGESTRIYVGHD